MYAFSSKSGSEPFRALGDLTWNDPIVILLLLHNRQTKIGETIQNEDNSLHGNIQKTRN